MQKQKKIMGVLAGKLASRFVALRVALGACLLVVALCALVLAGSSAASAEKPADAALAQRLDTVLDKAVAEGRIVGAVVMVSHYGQTAKQQKEYT